MNEDFYISLIYKKLSGDIDAGQTALLDTWLSENQSHRIKAQLIEEAWDVSGNLKTKPTVDLDKEFAVLEDRIKADEKIKPLPVAQSNGRRRWLSIAAGIAFLVAAGFLLRNMLGTANQTLDWISLQTNANQMDDLVLDDQSKIHINQNSVLKYPKVLGKDERRVFLEGEAFFEIEADSKRPFIIETPNEEIKVLGTSFNVRSYKDEKTTTVQVATGKVEVKSNNEAIQLVKGEKGINKHSENKLQKISQGSTNEFSWHSKKLTFKDTPMPEAIRHLQNHYGVNLEILDPVLANCPINLSLNDESITAYFEMLSTVYKAEVEKIDDRNYKIKGGSCD